MTPLQFKNPFQHNLDMNIDILGIIYNIFALKKSLDYCILVTLPLSYSYFLIYE